MTSYKKINDKHNIYRIYGPKIIEIEGKMYQRFMNFFYIPDYVYNLDEDYVITLNDLRHSYKDIVIDYEYNTEVEKRIFDSISKIIDHNKSLKVLDFGCGERNVNSIIQPIFNSVKFYGVDIRDINTDYLINYDEFKRITTNSVLPFEDNYFDIIIALFVFHFRITDIQIESLYHTLKDDGVLCFNLIKSADKNIINRLENVGFKIKEKTIEQFKDKKKIIEYYIMGK